MNKQCEDCPWRKDAPKKQFPRERYECLVTSVEQGFGPMFACHKSPEDNKLACVGYVMNQVREGGEGPQNLNLRLALARGKIEPEKMTLVGPQYKDYDAMVKANYPSWRRDGKGQR